MHYSTAAHYHSRRATMKMKVTENGETAWRNVGGTTERLLVDGDRRGLDNPLREMQVPTTAHAPERPRRRGWRALLGRELVRDLGLDRVEGLLLGREVAAPVGGIELVGGQLDRGEGMPELERRAALHVVDANRQQGDRNHADQQRRPLRVPDQPRWHLGFLGLPRPRIVSRSGNGRQ